MSDPILTFRDRYNPKDLTVSVSGEYLKIEYVVDQWFTDFCYVPLDSLFEAISEYFEESDLE